MSDVRLESLTYLQNCSEGFTPTRSSKTRSDLPTSGEVKTKTTVPIPFATGST